MATGGERARGVGKRLLTLGAKLTILPHPFIRKSALTTPPMRVPSISRLLFSNTAALSSNRTIRPSGRRAAFLQRTMTARRTSPRRTLRMFETACAPGEMGRARFTTQTISSPTPPHPLFTLFLSTLTHSTRSAPELSITCLLAFFFSEKTFGIRANKNKRTKRTGGTYVEGALEANHLSVGVVVQLVLCEPVSIDGRRGVTAPATFFPTSDVPLCLYTNLSSFSTIYSPSLAACPDTFFA